MRKFFAMMIVGLFVAGVAFEAYAQGCCAGGSKTETEETKEESSSCDS